MGEPATVGAVILGSDFKALGVIRSLGRQGIPCVLVDDLPRSAWFSRYAVRRFRWRQPMWGPPFVDYLVDLAREQGLEQWVLFPLQDEVVELVSRNAEQLAGAYRLVTQPWETLRWAHDKRLANQVAAEVGVSYPKTWYPARETDLDTLDVNFPVVIKPTVSIRLQYAIGRKALVAQDHAELRAQYQQARRILEPEEVMVQEVVPGDGHSQFAVAAFCDEGTVIAAMTARRTRQYPFDYGMSSSFVEAIEVPRLIEQASRMLRRLRLTGIVEVEFKHDARDGQDKFLDINIRPWGWHTLCIACGLDFPYAQYRHTVGEPITLPAPRYGLRWRRLITDIPAAIQEVRHGWTTAGAALRSMLGTSQSSVFDWRDPLPAIGDTAVCLTRVLAHGEGRALTAPEEPAMLVSSEA